MPDFRALTAEPKLDIIDIIPRWSYSPLIKMKKLSLALSLAFGTTAFAEVPALINYQDRLVDGVGNPIVGKKEFKLDIYDSQTEGTLIYQETLPDITLDEDGAYSFQFGAGESRSETSVLVATGDGEAAFFQKVFEETPVGVISVTDGTNIYKTGDVPTGDEPFSFTYTTSLKRLNLVCNETPAEGTKFTATFRYAESGIMGALGSAAEHWMEVTIGGEKQEPRQRLVAVPFALKSGVANRLKDSGELTSELISPSFGLPVKAHIKAIKGFRLFSGGGIDPKLKIKSLPKREYDFDLTVTKWDQMEEIFSYSLDENQKLTEIKGLDIILDHNENYYFIYKRIKSGSSVVAVGTYEIFFTK